MSDKLEKMGEKAAETAPSALGQLIEPEVFFKTFGFFQWKKQFTEGQIEAFKRGYRRRYAEITTPQPETD